MLVDLYRRADEETGTDTSSSRWREFTLREAFSVARLVGMAIWAPYDGSGFEPNGAFAFRGCLLPAFCARILLRQVAALASQ